MSRSIYAPRRGDVIRLDFGVLPASVHESSRLICYSILELMGQRGQPEAVTGAENEGNNADERTALFTSGVVALHDGHRAASPHLWMPWNCRTGVSVDESDPA